MYLNLVEGLKMSRLLKISGQRYLLATKGIITYINTKSPFIKGLNLILRFIVKSINDERLEQTCTL
jgi:hypothetical protein